MKNQPKIPTRRRIADAFAAIAAEDGVSVDFVRDEITAALQYALTHGAPTPEKKLLQSLAPQGGTPAPEDAVLLLSALTLARFGQSDEK